MACDLCHLSHQTNPEGPCLACHGAGERTFYGDFPIGPREEESSLPRLNHEVVKTREARTRTRQLATQLETLIHAFDEEHAPLLEALQTSREAQAAAEQRTRQAALALYEATEHQSKALTAGVSIREIVKIVYDVDEALRWALDGNHLAVTPACLNREVFEQLAKRYPLPFVTRKVTYQVLLSKNL